MALIKLFGNLRQFVDEPRFEVAGDTVRMVLENAGIPPPLQNAILDNGQQRPFVKIAINGRDIRLAQGLDTPINDKDTIAIFPPIAGG